MSLHYKYKCFVCLKTGGNLNIFNTYDEKHELYVDMIKNCFNIEITADSGLHEMCKDCSLELQKAYNFRKCIFEAVSKLVQAKVSETNENTKQCSDLQYMDNIPFNNVYDVDSVLNKEADHTTYNLDKITENGSYNYSNDTFDLDNDIRIEIKDKQGEEIMKQSVRKKDIDDALLTLDQSSLVHFTLDNADDDKCHDDNQMTLFMDLNNILQLDIANMCNENNIAIEDNEKKKHAEFEINHHDSYSLNVLIDNGLNSFLMDPTDVKVLDIDNNNVKHIVADVTEKPEIAPEPDLSYVPFVFNNESDKKVSFTNVTNVVADVDNVSETSKCKKVKRIVVKKKAEVDTVVQKSLISNNVEKNNVNIECGVDTNVNKSSATEDTLTDKKVFAQSNIKKTTIKIYKSKTVLNPENGQLTYVINKENENDESDCSIDVENFLDVDVPVNKEVKCIVLDNETVQRDVVELVDTFPEKTKRKRNTKSNKTVKKDVPELEQSDRAVAGNDLPETKKAVRRKKPVEKDIQENEQNDRPVADNGMPETKKAVRRKKPVKKDILEKEQNDRAIADNNLSETKKAVRRRKLVKKDIQENEQNDRAVADNNLPETKKAVRRKKPVQEDIKDNEQNDRPIADNNLPETKKAVRRKKPVQKHIKDNEQNDRTFADNGLPEPKKAKKRNKRVKEDISENKSDCSMDVDNDLPVKKKAKRNTKRKKTVQNNAEKKDADTVKENVPAKVEDVKPKKKNRGSKADPFKEYYIMPGQTQCAICNAEFESTILLSGHMSADHPPEYICAVCGAKFETKFKHKVHSRTHEKGPFFCKFCNQEFSNVNTRNTHEWRVHSKPEPFKCAHCGERFKTYLKRLRHLQSVHGDSTQYPCSYCNKSFAYAAYRTKHIQIMHLNTRSYRCDQCPASFAKRGGLDSHRASKHDIGEKKYECPVCQFKFFARSAWKWHVEQLHNRHACSYCTERFETVADLQVHTKTHEITSLDMSMSLDLMPTFGLDGLNDYALMDSDYMDLNVL